MDFGANVAQRGPAGVEVGCGYHGSPGRSASPRSLLGRFLPVGLGGPSCEPPAAALEGAPPSPGPKLSLAPLGRGEPRSSPSPHFRCGTCRSSRGLRGRGLVATSPGALWGTSDARNPGVG